jgi:putative sporulation protein YyaC
MKIKECTKINHDKCDSINLISEDLYQRIKSVNKLYDNIIFVCIGTDRATGDTLAPLIGTFLSNNKNINLYGTLNNPVHAKNLHTTIDNIDTNNNLIIAIDASLGKFENIGKISLENKSMKAGSGVGKDLPAVGDISIKGIVNMSGYMEIMVLQNTRLSLVYNMAQVIAKAIHLTMNRIHKEYLELNSVAV